jgi:hypothetical protein
MLRCMSESGGQTESRRCLVCHDPSGARYYCPRCAALLRPRPGIRVILRGVRRALDFRYDETDSRTRRQYVMSDEKIPYEPCCPDCPLN